MTKEYIAKDFLGNELKVGDIIVFIARYYKELTQGYIIRIGPVMIITDNGSKVFPKNAIKINIDDSGKNSNVREELSHSR